MLSASCAFSTWPCGGWLLSEQRVVGEPAVSGGWGPGRGTSGAPVFSGRALGGAPLLDVLALHAVPRGGNRAQAGQRDGARASLADAEGAGLEPGQSVIHLVELMPLAALQARQCVRHVLYRHVLEGIARLNLQRGQFLTGHRHGARELCVGGEQSPAKFLDEPG